MAATNPTEKKSLGTRLVLSGLGLVLAALGVTFTFLLWHSYQRGEETRHWQQTPCEIIYSEVLTDKPTPNSPVQYRPQVQYRYVLNGAVFHSTLIRRGEGPTSDKDKAQARCNQYKIGLKTVCFVNPAEPGKAVLEHTSRAGLYSIWFPLLFVAAGFGMIRSAWRRR